MAEEYTNYDIRELTYVSVGDISAGSPEVITMNKTISLF